MVFHAKRKVSIDSRDLKKKREQDLAGLVFCSEDYAEKPDLHNVNSGLIKSLLRSLARRGVYLTTTRIQKLFYLIERQCVLDTGKRCLGLDYRYDHYGMYSPQLKGIMNNLDPAKDHLAVKNFECEKGMGKMVDYVGDGPNEEEIPANVQDATLKIVTEYGYLKTDALIRSAKATSPFLSAKMGEYLNWDVLLEERCSDTEKLSDKGLARLAAASQFKESRTFEDIDALNSYLFP